MLNNIYTRIRQIYLTYRLFNNWSNLIASSIFYDSVVSLIENKFMIYQLFKYDEGKSKNGIVRSRCPFSSSSNGHIDLKFGILLYTVLVSMPMQTQSVKKRLY